MERLLADTDHQRHFTLIAEPFWILYRPDDFCRRAGQTGGSLAQFLGDEVQAVLASGYVEDDLFLELRAYPRIDKDHGNWPPSIVPSWPSCRRGWNPIWPRSIRLPMERRSCCVFHGCSINCSAPRARCRTSPGRVARLPAGQPGQNLLLASEFALWEQPKAGAGSAGGAPKKPAGAGAALAKQISISFPRDTLENSLQMVSTEIGVEISILGTELQLEGITKNQSFSLNERDQPAREILRKILKLANSDGKLVYVIKPPPAGGEPIIFITTRAAAAKRGNKLPPVEKK